MKIQSLQYEDLSTGWKLDLIDFNPQLTLLVGVSGVGKTQILKVLFNLKNVSQGTSLNGVAWKIKFLTSTGHNCEWSGSFENNGFISHFSPSDWNTLEKMRINNEKLVVDDVTIVDRSADNIIFNGEKIVKLSRSQSIIYSLKEESQINEIYANFKIIGSNVDLLNTGIDSEILNQEKYQSLNEIRNSDKHIAIKLYFLYKNYNNLFNEIVRSFIDIFPCVEDVKIESVMYHQPGSFPYNIAVIKIKEKNIENWIEEPNLSSGMWKSFLLLAEFYLCADNSVILIDEFENHLGINCINEVTYQILASERNLQFIITSHHPYIINKIGYDYWKIVTRKGSIVKCIDAKEFGIGKSKHQAFIQLANLTEYSVGIES